MLLPVCLQILNDIVERASSCNISPFSPSVLKCHSDPMPQQQGNWIPRDIAVGQLQEGKNCYPCNTRRHTATLAVSYLCEEMGVFLVAQLQAKTFFGHSMWHVGSQFPDQGSNPHSLCWKHGVLTTGPPGSPEIGFLKYNVHLVKCTDIKGTAHWVFTWVYSFVGLPLLLALVMLLD